MTDSQHYLVAPTQPNLYLNPDDAHLRISALIEEEMGVMAETTIKHVIRDPQGNVEKIWLNSQTTDGRRWRTETTQHDIWIDQL